jgi:hypothetical protein
MQQFGLEKSCEDFFMARIFRQITDRDRVLISHLKTKGMGVSEIARRVGKDKSSISRELRRNALTVSRDEQVFWLGVRHLMTDDELREYLAKLTPKELSEFEDKTHWSAREAQRTRDSCVFRANQVRLLKLSRPNRCI